MFHGYIVISVVNSGLKQAVLNTYLVNCSNVSVFETSKHQSMTTNLQKSQNMGCLPLIISTIRHDGINHLSLTSVFLLPLCPLYDLSLKRSSKFTPRCAPNLPLIYPPCPLKVWAVKSAKWKISPSHSTPSYSGETVVLATLSEICPGCQHGNS